MVLGALFVPDSVAVIGATERPGTVGRTVLSNLTESRFRRKRMPSQLSQPRGSSLDRLRYPRLLIKSEQF
jgi:acetyltransferase